MYGIMDDNRISHTTFWVNLVFALVIGWLIGYAQGHGPVSELECKVDGYARITEKANGSVEEHNQKIRSLQESLSNYTTFEELSNDLPTAITDIGELDTLGEPACES